jgi:mannose-1-phosphate guanylyltransferase
MTAAMVLCAGLGTRLRPLTDHVAKPLVPVGDRAALDHILARLTPFGPVVVNAHHRAMDVEAHLRGTRVLLSIENELLGTAGGVARAAPLLGEGDVLVYNGDILCDLDLPFENRHDATLIVRPAQRGNMGIDRDGLVVRMRQETFRSGEVRGVDFLGVHVIGAALRRRLPEMGCLVGDLYMPALRAGARIAVREIDRSFYDIGTLASYRAANLAWLGDREAYSEGTVAPGVQLERSIVGRGAIVDGAGKLERVIVWPGARATAPLADAVVTPWAVL